MYASSRVRVVRTELRASCMPNFFSAVQNSKGSRNMLYNIQTQTLFQVRHVLYIMLLLPLQILQHILSHTTYNMITKYFTKVVVRFNPFGKEGMLTINI